MSTRPAHHRSRRRRRVLAATGLAVAIATPAVVHADGGRGHDGGPRLEGRAVLPVATYAPGPPSGFEITKVPADLEDGFDDGKVNGIQFPTPSQPVEGFSGIVEGRVRGEYLAMADNGYGTKANSYDFNLRAYYLRPDFKTARGGSGDVGVHGYIEFTDPWHQFPHPIVNEATRHRILTGADVDPESIQRARNGDLWVGDEFGPWVLHFDAKGRLLEAPFDLPDGLIALANPLSDHDNNPDTPPLVPPTVNGSRGIEAMAMTPNGRYLYVILEGAVIADADQTTRRIYEFDVRRGEWTGRMTDYRADLAAHFVADAQAIDRNRLLVIERDNIAAAVRHVYEIDLRDEPVNGALPKTEVLDLAAIPDPKGVSLPAIHEGDVGLGDPFRVMCESIEALRILSDTRLLLGCDNNFPNKGRNPGPPGLADDNELITVEVPRL